jgi:ATP-dependent Zn protease
VKEAANEAEEAVHEASAEVDTAAAAVALAKQAAAEARAAQEAAVKEAQEAAKEAAREVEKEVKQVVEEAKEETDSALSNLKDKLVALQKKLMEHKCLIADKVKNVSPSQAKKIAAGVLGVWGVSVGAGWVAQNINNKAPEEVAASAVQGGRRK